MAITQFLIFILIFSFLYLGIHMFVYFQIITGLLPKVNINIFFRLLFWLSAFSFMLSEFLQRRLISLWIKPLAYYGSIWLGVISISLTVFFIRILFLSFLRSEGFKYYSTIGSIFLIAGLSIFSVYNAVRPEIIKEVIVKTSKLPQNIRRFTIVQISDLHLNLLKPPRRLKEIVERVDSLNPDLVVITGDLIDADIGKISEICGILKSIKSKYGVYAITGNHEFYAGLDKFYAALSCADIIPLRNEHRIIAGAIEVVGIDDTEAERFLHQKIDFEKTFNTPVPVDHSKFVLFLAHRPDFFDKARKLGIDLQLSGHLHAGQIPPLDFIEVLFFKYPLGFYQKSDGAIYTTSGTGYWGPPMRLFSRSEIVKINIENNKP